MPQQRPTRMRVTCPHDGHSFEVDPAHLERGNETGVSCPMCGAFISIKSANTEHIIRVEGHSASDVEKVASRVLADLHHQSQAAMTKSPWVSGSFYLTALVAVVALLLAVARLVSIALFPLVVIGGLVATSIVGAFQLRQDAKLSQKSFLELMGLTFRQLPFIASKPKSNGKGPAA